MYNTLFAVEKRRNDTLNDQLKQSYMDSAKTKLSYNELNILLQQMSQEKVKLVQENVSKQTENDNLQELLQSTKRELFQASTQQREQLEQLTRVQLECQNAKFDIEELTVQLEELREELTKKLEELRQLHDMNVTAELLIRCVLCNLNESSAHCQFSYTAQQTKEIRPGAGAQHQAEGRTGGHTAELPCRHSGSTHSPMLRPESGLSTCHISSDALRCLLHAAGHAPSCSTHVQCCREDQGHFPWQQTR